MELTKFSKHTNLAESTKGITVEKPRSVCGKYFSLMELHRNAWNHMELHGLGMESHGQSMIDAWNFTSIILFNVWKRLLVFIQYYSYL